MIYGSEEIELAAALEAARRVCAAARTAPKARGIDQIHTMILTGEDKNRLADTLRLMGEDGGPDFYLRDAGNLLCAQAVALIGVSEGQRGLNEMCGYCHFENCAACCAAGATCVYDAMDLGVAVGSAVSVAADARVDSRVMFSVGKAALALDLFAGKATMVMGIPLSVSGKSPFFDRKKK
ncbi:MAG: DUF2148 domain-containing protein [Clostridia bacterium]